MKTISKVKLISHGVGGIQVWSTGDDVRGGTSFLKEMDIKHKVPVPKSMRDLFLQLEDHARAMLGVLEETYDVVVTGVLSNLNRVKLMCQVTTYDSQVYSVLTVVMMDGTEYSGYQDLINTVSSLYEAVAEYVGSNSKLSDSQILMDFQEFGSDKAKKELEGVDISKLSLADQAELAIKFLEKQGCMIMKPDDFEATEEEDEKAFTEQEFGDSLDENQKENLDAAGYTEGEPTEVEPEKKSKLRKVS